MGEPGPQVCFPNRARRFENARATEQGRTISTLPVNFRVVTRAHGERVRERHGMKKIVCLRLSATALDVHEHYFAADAGHHQGVRGG